jgi:hypothetical protein
MNNLANVFVPILGAAGNLQQNLGQVAGVLNAIAILLFFGGLLMSAIMFMIGRTEYLKYGLVGSGLGGLAWVIVTTFFQAGNGVDPGIQLQNF